jgi:hypothetical protein
MSAGPRWTCGRASRSPELTLLGDSDHGCSPRWIQNGEDDRVVLTDGDTWWQGGGDGRVSMMSGGGVWRFDDEANGVRRGETGGGMSYSGDRPR